MRKMRRKLDKIDFFERIFLSCCLLFSVYSFLIIYANIKHNENKKHEPFEDLIEIDVQQEKINNLNYFVSRG
jgi:hypothetical protein